MFSKVRFNQEYRWHYCESENLEEAVSIAEEYSNLVGATNYNIVIITRQEYDDNTM